MTEKSSSFSSSEWLRFRQSGFYFRLKNGFFVQGAVQVHEEDQDLQWEMCSAMPAMRFFVRNPEYFTSADEESMKVLSRIPAQLTSKANYNYVLGIIAE